MSTQTAPASTRTRRDRNHIPLLPPTAAYVALTVLGLMLPALLAGVRPWSSDHALLAFFQHHTGAAHASAFFMLAAAVPFSIFTAVATTRLRTLGLDVPGRIIAQVGGTLATAMLAFAGVATLAATQAHVAESDAAVRVLYGLSFAAGGPAFVIFSGLLVLGVSLTGLIGRVLPPQVGWFGVGVALVSELAALAALSDRLDVLLPIGRFGGLVWMIATAATLPASRKQQRDQR
ncbi:MAG: hypothetical protein QOI15_1151 [Pseudonocardiales bacterium]|nr:hypothetical protein [Pseudonocardiales bacterium]